MNNKLRIRLYSGITFFSIIAWFLYCAVNPVTKKREFMLLSEADEYNLGKQTDQSVIETYGIYNEPELLNSVSSIGKTMGSLSHRPHLDYNFKILDTPVINAFAVPGGFVYMTRGILAYLNNEAELAGVIGHEIGHITARHSAKQYSKAQLAQLGLGLGAALSETFRNYAGIADFGVGMLFLKYSRDNERQADALGVEYSTKAGYDSNHMANFFDTLERLHPGSDQSGLPAWFSTHPNPPDRVNAVKRDTKTWQAKYQNKTFAVNRQKYLNTIDGIVFGEDPRQGYVENSMFYHPRLKFQFPVPAGWKVNNTPNQVQIFNEKQDAVIIFTLAKESSPSAAANTFITNSKATVIKSETARVNGLTAYSVISDISTEQGVIRVMSYFIQKSNTVYTFHGYSSNTQFDTYSGSFRTTMTGFNNLTNPSKINVQPSRLRVKKITNGGKVRDILTQYGVPNDKLAEMAIMNGMDLDQNLPRNSYIKIVTK